MVGCDWRWTSLVPGGPWVAGAGVAVMKPDLPQACAVEMAAGGRTGHQLDRAKLGPDAQLAVRMPQRQARLDTGSRVGPLPVEPQHRKEQQDPCISGRIVVLEQDVVACSFLARYLAGKQTRGHGDA
jgi:hypothetical protein